MKYFLLTSVIALVATSAAFGQETRPGRLDREVRDALVPGLRVEVVTPRGEKDVASARLAALFVSERQSVTPFVERGPFRATLDGYLKLRLRGRYAFSLRGRGRVKVAFNDAIVLDADGDFAKAAPVEVELVKGYNRLRVEYTRPADGDAALRLFWSGEQFPAEPVPPTILLHDGRDADWRSGQQLRAGRLLVARHRCLWCHKPGDDVDITSMVAMPEHGRAPRLEGAGKRLSLEWIERKILEPNSVRGDAAMPRVLVHLSEAEARAAARDLAAYVHQIPVSRDDDGPEEEGAADTASADTPDDDARDDDAMRKGELLFTDRGCLACHRFAAPAEVDAHDRVSLAYTGAKFQPGALAGFLKAPRRHFPTNRMPTFALDDTEAAALEAFIVNSGSPLPELAAKPPAGDATRGKKLFLEVGCAECHGGVGTMASWHRELPPPVAVERGCLSNAARVADDASGGHRAPEYDFPADARQAILAFLATDQRSLGRRVPAEFATRQIEALRCTACHRRDGQKPALAELLLEEGARGLPLEPIPDLTWTGEKLWPQWVAPFVAGETTERPRPHLRIRMPAFPEHGAHFGEGLSHQHGLAIGGDDTRPAFDSELAETGKAIAAMQTGLACHRCHAIGEKEAAAPFESRSTNFAHTTSRLRYEYFRRWMRDPLRVDPHTKMLRFAPDGKKTALTRYFDGDAERQFEAIWHYLESIRRENTPIEFLR